MSHLDFVPVCRILLADRPSAVGNNQSSVLQRGKFV